MIFHFFSACMMLLLYSETYILKLGVSFVVDVGSEVVVERSEVILERSEFTVATTSVLCFFFFFFFGFGGSVVLVAGREGGPGDFVASFLIVSGCGFWVELGGCSNLGLLETVSGSGSISPLCVRMHA